MRKSCQERQACGNEFVNQAHSIRVTTTALVWEEAQQQDERNVAVRGVTAVWQGERAQAGSGRRSGSLAGGRHGWSTAQLHGGRS